MPKIAYVPKKFGTESLALIERANAIAEQYAADNYSLTLRQLYYRLVAAGIIPNTQQSYKRVGNVINDARLAGLVDWNHLTDRTRNLQRLSTWSTPSDMIASAAYSYRLEVWQDQLHYLEVWVEKEALADVVGQAADRWDVPYFSCRGYVSQSEMWAAAMRLKRMERRGKLTRVIHLGDHDPSGIDMTRDIEDRLRMFGSFVKVERIALTMDQITEYDPPPNPAKTTDARYASYEELYGDESWELDALPPDVLDALITRTIRGYVDVPAWNDSKRRQETERAELNAASANWPETRDWLDGQGYVDEPEVEEIDDDNEDGDDNA